TSTRSSPRTSAGRNPAPPRDGSTSRRGHRPTWHGPTRTKDTLRKLALEPTLVGMDRPSRPISDPGRIRALAHPLRLELLDHLRDVGEATATECAAQVGESVASCSFHLRMLAKYGFLERAERRGKEKPWRVVGEGSSLQSRPDP